MKESTRYPRTVDIKGNEVVLELLTADKKKDVLAFTQSLPAHDLLFLRRDITSPECYPHGYAKSNPGKL